MMVDPVALEMKDVHRTFRRGRETVTAVNGITLTIPRGFIMCVLGPNGAGKTTAVKMASTLLEPSSGEIEVVGVNTVSSPRSARKHIGLVLGGDRGFYLRATALENLKFFATLAGVPGRSVAARAESAIRQVGLEGRQRDRVETYSRGMKQRLHIARAILNCPALLLLDEPSIGLDPEGARDLRQLVREQRDAGCGILMTTHYLEEARELADGLAVIDQGQIAARGSAEDIAALGDVDTVTTSFVRELSAGVEASIRSCDAVSDVAIRPRQAGYEVDLVWTREAAHTNRLEALFQTHIEWMTTRPVTLEESYLAFIAKKRAR